MKIGVIGAGRLGICFALLCEAAGHPVLVSDVRKDYVDAADAALLDSLSALDSVVTANALWSDDGYGNITNSNSGDVIIEANKFELPAFVRFI